MNLKIIQDTAQGFLKENATTLLTAGGVVGAVATAVVSFRAGFKCSDLIREEELKHVHPGGLKEGPTDVIEGTTMGLDNRQKFKLVYPHLIPPTAITGLTMGAVIASNMMSAKRAAALAAAYGVSQRSLEEYKAKVAEKLTGPKTQAITDEIAQDRVDNNPPQPGQIVILGGDVLCYDMLTDRYFQSNAEQILKAAAEINTIMMNSQAVSLSEFYDKLGLKTTNLSDVLGWSMMNQDLPIEVRLVATKTPDEKPCLAIEFNVQPTTGYERTYS